MGSNGADAPIRIVLADDHSVIRSGLRVLLGEDNVEVVGEAEDVAGTARMVEKRKPDVLVLDLQMPGADPVEDVPRLIESNPRTRIVVLTMRNDPLTARQMLRAGASGYVLKQAADSRAGRSDPDRRPRRQLREPAAGSGAGHGRPRSGGAAERPGPGAAAASRPRPYQSGDRRAPLPERQGDRSQPQAGCRASWGSGAVPSSCASRSRTS